MWCCCTGKLQVYRFYSDYQQTVSFLELGEKFANTFVITLLQVVPGTQHFVTAHTVDSLGLSEKRGKKHNIRPEKTYTHTITTTNKPTILLLSYTLRYGIQRSIYTSSICKLSFWIFMHNDRITKHSLSKEVQWVMDSSKEFTTN